MNSLKSFKQIINWQTFIILSLSISSTYFCRAFNFTADFPLTLVGIAVVFPLVFSINSAYRRRETALNHYGILKGNGRAIYFASRDWIEEPDAEKMKVLKNVLGQLFDSINQYLHSENDDHLVEEKYVLDNFRKLSLAIKGFRTQGMSGSEVSRNNQYLNKMLIAFEQLKHIYQYRTPLTLRAYSTVFISILPIIYGPYFANVTMGNSIGMAFILPFLFSIILVSLDNIQEHLENPFDKLGEDDVYINAEKFMNSLSSKGISLPE